MTLVKVAIKNLLRKPARSITIIIAAVLSCALIFGGTMIFSAIGRSVKNGIEKLGADIMVIPAKNVQAARKVLLSAEPTGFYMDLKNLEKVKTVQGVSVASPQLFVASTKFACCGGLPVSLLVGYDPKTDFTISPWVRAKYEPWKGHEDLDAVTVGTKLAFTGNSDLRFYGKQFRLGSLLYPTGLAYMDYGIFMSMDAIRDMINVSKTKAVQSLTISPDEISSILVKVEKNFDAHAVAKEIEASLPGVKTIVTRDLIEDVRKDVEVAIWGVMALGILCWLMMLVLMALVFSMSVNERGRELGILRAMGATKTHVFGLIMSEALMLSGTGAVAGAFLSLFAILNFKYLIAKTVGNIHFLWPSSLFILSLAIGCILSIVLSSAMTALYPAIKISLKEPYDAIHEGM